MLTPALIGGAAAGVLSAVPIVNCLCCIWIIGGAMLAAYLLVKDSPVVLSAGDGAILGVLTGIIAAVVDVIVDIPFRAVNLRIMQEVIDRLSQFAEEMPEGWENWMEPGGRGEFTLPMFLLGLLFSVVIFSALGALGGIIGISLFGKKKPPEQPQGPSHVSENSSHRQS